MDRMTIVGKDGKPMYITEGEKVRDVREEDPSILNLDNGICPGCWSPVEFCICATEDEESQENE